jgi:hypothetical protein
VGHKWVSCALLDGRAQDVPPLVCVLFKVHNNVMGYAIEYSDEALADLLSLRAFDRARIVDAITANLTHEPMVATRHR